MAQHLYFTLEKDFFVGLFKLSREDAFAALMECLLNQFLQAESEEVLRVANYERSEDRQDYRNGTRDRTITTRIGKIVIAVPRHRNEPFHSTLIIARISKNDPHIEDIQGALVGVRFSDVDFTKKKTL